MTEPPPELAADDPRLPGVRRLLAIMDRLRDPGGCPWDREQTPETLRRYLLEECFELLEALDQGDPKAIQEELGDVLLQVAFHARITQEQGAYHFGDVAQGIADKLLHRHPHVFGDVEVADAAAVEANWEQLKQAEKQDERSSLLDGIPGGMTDARVKFVYAPIALFHRRAGEAGLRPVDRKGFIFNPVSWRWSLSARDLSVNYVTASLGPV